MGDEATMVWVLKATVMTIVLGVHAVALVSICTVYEAHDLNKKAIRVGHRLNGRRCIVTFEGTED